MRSDDLFRCATPHVGDIAIHETADGILLGEVTRTSGLATTIKWETGAQSIHRILPGGDISILGHQPCRSLI